MLGLGRKTSSVTVSAMHMITQKLLQLITISHGDFPGAYQRSIENRKTEANSTVYNILQSEVTVLIWKVIRGSKE